MTPNELLILNFQEIRRRSCKAWSAWHPDYYYWKPDPDAMSCLEMVRHVLEGEHLYHMIIEKKVEPGNYTSPWEGRPYTTLEEETAFSNPFRESFLTMVKGLNQNDLRNIQVIRTDKGQKRSLGDYLLRMAYHEAVHTGQFLSYLRLAEMDRPVIWD